MKLRTELALGFVAVLALTVAVGIVALIGQARSAAALDKLLDVDARIAELSARASSAMLKARRAEKDFLIYRNRFGFNEARSR